MPRKASKKESPRSKSRKKPGDGAAKRGGVLKRAVAAVKGALKRRGRAKAKPMIEATDPNRKSKRGSAKAARVARREADIPLNRIAETYTPTQTSLKAGFRATGADHQRDQEFARGVDDNRWKDEDRFTNKSGDPRIGTHGRTYEPGEKKNE